MTDATKIAALIKAGFDAVNCRIPIEIDGSGISVRNLFIEVEEKITCYWVEDWEPQQMFAMPKDAAESAATAVVLKILTGVVGRAVESTSRDLSVAA
jgi:hypothetical protein